MNKIFKISTTYLLSLCTFIFLGTMLHSQGNVFESKNTWQIDESVPPQMHLQQSISKTIQYAEALDPIRADLLDLFTELCQEQVVIKDLPDKEVRPLFVNLQALFEQHFSYELKCGKITKLVGMIHTPTPATPLCSEGTITPNLIHQSMKDDPRRIFTVLARADIIRNLLKTSEEVRMLVVYPKGGLDKRTVEQQNIYLKTLSEHPTTLEDHELPCASIDHDMLGASYLFENEDGEQFLLSLRSYQANAPADDNSWAMWYGKVDEPETRMRLNRIQEFLAENEGPLFFLP